MRKPPLHVHIYRFSRSCICTKIDRTGTPVYVAPEVVTSQHYNQFADIFSFGVTLFFVVVADFDFVMDQYVYGVRFPQAKGWRPSPPNEPPSGVENTVWFELLELISECWAQDPSHRPTFAQVSMRLPKPKDLVMCKPAPILKKLQLCTARTDGSILQPHPNSLNASAENAVLYFNTDIEAQRSTNEDSLTALHPPRVPIYNTCR